MTRGFKVRRGVVMLSLVVAGSAGCAGARPAGEPVARAAAPASRPAATPEATRPAASPATGRQAAAPTRTTQVVNFPVGSWRRLPLSPPVRVEIPAIGVSAPLVRLGLDPDGTMQVPGDFQVAGWFTGGSQPGQLGPAVIAGHVDSHTGPAVFYRLRDLRPGDQVRVVRADGLVVRFTVESLASYPKWSLPDEAVFGATTAPALRLITCAGTFDRTRHSYRDNLVVSAVRVADGHRGTGTGR
jgi:sortase (surface protein transpeptidase)